MTTVLTLQTMDGAHENESLDSLQEQLLELKRLLLPISQLLEKYAQCISLRDPNKPNKIPPSLKAWRSISPKNADLFEEFIIFLAAAKPIVLQCHNSLNAIADKGLSKSKNAQQLLALFEKDFIALVDVFILAGDLHHRISYHLDITLELENKAWKVIHRIGLYPASLGDIGPLNFSDAVTGFLMAFTQRLPKFDIFPFLKDPTEFQSLSETSAILTKCLKVIKAHNLRLNQSSYLNFMDGFIAALNDAAKGRDNPDSLPSILLKPQISTFQLSGIPYTVLTDKNNDDQLDTSRGKYLLILTQLKNLKTRADALQPATTELQLYKMMLQRFHHETATLYEIECIFARALSYLETQENEKSEEQINRIKLARNKFRTDAYKHLAQIQRKVLPRVTASLFATAIKSEIRTSLDSLSENEIADTLLGFSREEQMYYVSSLTTRLSPSRYSKLVGILKQKIDSTIFLGIEWDFLLFSKQIPNATIKQLIHFLVTEQLNVALATLNDSIANIVPNRPRIFLRRSSQTKSITENLAKCESDLAAFKKRLLVAWKDPSITIGRAEKDTYDMQIHTLQQQISAAREKYGLPTNTTTTFRGHTQQRLTTLSA